jgi:hypothetical protein
MFVKKSFQSLYWLYCLFIIFLLSACGQPTAQAAGNNNQPSISGIPPTAAEVGIRYDFIPIASDSDGDRLRFEIEHRPKWTSFDKSSGRLTGIPNARDVGTRRNIIIRVTDGKASAFLPAFDITVTNPPASNTPPAITGSPTTTAYENSSYVFSPTASDADGDVLSFSILNKPGWASFDVTSGVLSGTPFAADVGTTMDITIRVSDGKTTVSLPAFDITVLSSTPANHAPSISGIPPATVTQDTAYRFAPMVTDPDGDNLIFSIINKPSWSSFNSVTGILAGTPGNSDVDTTSNIVIIVSDGTLSASLPPFSITVTNVNDAPIISGTPATSTQQDTVYSFTPTASDPDGDALTFSISNKPVWASFNALTGTLTGTPSSTDIGTTSNILIGVSDGAISSSLPAFTITVTASIPPGTGPAPLVLFTDIVSGPNNGGENNQGAYLSIFGLNFGQQSGLGSTTNVFINGIEVAVYKFMGLARSQFLDVNQPIQQISVQIGAIGNPTPGVPLPITVEVNGLTSNINHTFIVQPGDILYVDNVTGNDNTAVTNDINYPWRYVQTPTLGGALGQAGPGDFIVMRGGNIWSDVGYGNRFLRFRYKAGTAPNGIVENGPITVMSYPGEDVHILPQSGTSGGFHGVSDSFPQDSDWITIANLRIEGGDRTVVDGPINLQAHSDNWRIVNNELFDWFAEDGTLGTQAKSAAIAGNGTDIKILGNHIHHIDGGTLNHGIYLDTGATNVEIAYNHIHHMDGGNIIQTFDNLGMANLNGIEIHHNRMHDGNRYGINASAGTGTLQFWNNIVYNTSFAGLRFAVKSPGGIEIYHNTFYNVCITPPTENYGAINNDDNTAGGNIQLVNNIVYPSPFAKGYFINTSDSSGLILNNNLYHGLTTALPSMDLNAIGADPLLLAPLASDFHLSSASSPAVDAAAPLTPPIPNDFGFLGRHEGSYPDIGAYEYDQ